MAKDPKNLGRAEVIESITGEKSIHFQNSVATSLKSFRSDRTESIYLIAPKMIREGMHNFFTFSIYFLGPNICGQTFLITLMKYIKGKSFDIYSISN